ncbi:unnamed protein product, partial [Didymodactylos carnosus]
KIQIQNMLCNPNLENETQVLCTWHLPRGRRQINRQYEAKAILMTGHYHQFDDCIEPLFVARCQTLLTNTPHAPNDSHSIKLILTDTMCIDEVSGQ